MNPRIVRELFVLTDKYLNENYSRISEEAIVDAMVQTCNNKAMKTAKDIGFKEFHIYTNWWIEVSALECPMYLLGPDAPQIKTYKDCFKHGFPARYTITIRESL
jgi:hypothetical protein